MFINHVGSESSKYFPGIYADKTAASYRGAWPISSDDIVVLNKKIEKNSTKIETTSAKVATKDEKSSSKKRNGEGKNNEHQQQQQSRQAAVVGYCNSNEQVSQGGSTLPGLCGRSSRSGGNLKKSLKEGENHNEQLCRVKSLAHPNLFVQLDFCSKNEHS